MAPGVDRPRGIPQVRAAARVVAGCLAAAVGLFGAPGPFAPLPARALPAIIQVTTTSDDEFPADGLCSLRAAILASNVGGYAGYCDAGTAEQDSIRFNIGSGVPVINVGSSLPTITYPVTIRGNTGGATRVQLHGPGSGAGLTIFGGADGSSIRSLVIDNFSDGISVSAGVTITGSIVGPNSGNGIYATGGGVQIGGTTGVTLGGPCTGDCNLVSGNGNAGLYLAAGGTVQGNFIGTTASGTAANGNNQGILVSSGAWTIGGASVAARNVVSGNTNDGLYLNACLGCSIQGNFIGTNAAGTTAIANGSAGLAMDQSSTTTISGNVISGNGGSGIELLETVDVTIQGNRIGTTAGGSAGLGNGGAGVFLETAFPGPQGTLIGSATDAAAANVIAFNTGAGVRIEGMQSKYNEVRRNSIHDNGGAGISLESSANESIAAPSITSLGPITGTACPGCAVDIYSDSADEGRIFEGSVTANGTGQWSYPSLVSGPKVTATNTDTFHNTSAFSTPVAFPLPPFTDIANSPFRLDIEWLYGQGITTGCQATRYCPSDPVTREQMASFLSRMFSLPSTATDYFTDDEASIHEANINKLAAAGITTGCTATTFCPRALVTRAQMASFLVRAAHLTVGAGRNYFNDDNGNLHEANIDRAAAAGIASGCGTWHYCPTGSVTREQMAAFLHRVIHPVAPPPYPAPPPP